MLEENNPVFSSEQATLCLLFWSYSICENFPQLTWFFILFRLQPCVRKQVLVCSILLGLRCFNPWGQGTRLWHIDGAPLPCRSKLVTVWRGPSEAGGPSVCGDHLHLLLLPWERYQWLHGVVEGVVMVDELTDPFRQTWVQTHVSQEDFQWMTTATYCSQAEAVALDQFRPADYNYLWCTCWGCFCSGHQLRSARPSRSCGGCTCNIKIQRFMTLNSYLLKGSSVHFTSPGPG